MHLEKFGRLTDLRFVFYLLLDRKWYQECDFNCKFPSLAILSKEKTSEMQGSLLSFLNKIRKHDSYKLTYIIHKY